MSGEATTATEVKAFLDAIGGLGPIRVGTLDATPDVLGAIYEYGGLSPDPRFGVVGVGYERPSLQIIFRGAPDDYETPRRKAQIAFEELAAVQPGVLSAGNTEYLTIKPQQSPFSLGKDANRRFEISCNFYIVKEPS